MLSHKCIQWLTFALAALVFLTEASCPNKCSGHGACGANDVCQCKQNWTGGDCSLRVCPYTRAWVDAPQNNDDAHYYAECGNKGSCDRTTGMCVCDAGYTGSGCRRQVCPNDCSGHGTCEFIEELSSSTTMTTSWEQQKIMGCKCDPGFEGHDCASRMCPKGDDPVTSYDQELMEQYIHYAPASITPAATDYGAIYLSYLDPYGATWTTAAITPPDNSHLNAADSTTYATFCTSVQTALRNIPQLALKDVSVSVLSTTVADGTKIGEKVTRTTDAVSDGTIANPDDITVTTTLIEYACKIVFPNAAGTSGLQNILRCHKDAKTTAGSQPLLEATSTGAQAASCDTGEFVITGTSSRKLMELATCSNRGLCDGSTGDCQCFAGHRGLACNTQEALV